MSTEGRLSSLEAELARLLRAGAEDSLRRFAARAAQLVADDVKLDEPEVREAIAVADAMAHGAVAAERVRRAREAVAAVVRRLDEVGFRLHRRAEEEERFESEAFQAEYGAAFNRARAANAAMTALSVDPREAAVETAYEATVGANLAEERLVALAIECGCGGS